MVTNIKISAINIVSFASVRQWRLNLNSENGLHKSIPLCSWWPMRVFQFDFVGTQGTATAIKRSNMRLRQNYQYKLPLGKCDFCFSNTKTDANQDAAPLNTVLVNSLLSFVCLLVISYYWRLCMCVCVCPIEAGQQQHWTVAFGRSLHRSVTQLVQYCSPVNLYAIDNCLAPRWICFISVCFVLVRLIVSKTKRHMGSCGTKNESDALLHDQVGSLSKYLSMQGLLLFSAMWTFN